jgi:hypothetical protein
MSNQNSLGTYQKLVFAAYGFFLVLGISWLVMTFTQGRGINYMALLLIAVFALQTYYKRLLANLVVGIIMFFFSVFMTLQTINLVVLASREAPLTLTAKLLTTVPLLSLFFSVVLVFSYRQLNFRDS